MSLIASRASLLHTAVQDLFAGKRDAALRLPSLAGHAADPDLAELLRGEAARALTQADRLAGVGAEAQGPRNLWMAGILDDAERDAQQTEPGPLLDVALIGAIRKAKAAEIVSSETAIALGEAISAPDQREVAAANRAEEIDSDRALKTLLDRITGA